MEIPFFASWTQLASGLVVGFLFGFLLRKAHVTRFPVIVGQFLLKDFTVMKVMMTAIAFGALGIYALLSWMPELGLLITSKMVNAALIGGGIFGVGMAILGYCPGTSIAALADGARDVWFGILGMLFGSFLFAEIYPWIKPLFFEESQMTKETLPNLFGISPWIIIGVIFMLLLPLFILTHDPESD